MHSRLPQRLSAIVANAVILSKEINEILNHFRFDVTLVNIS